jgi:uncharacterized membrane protein YdjX (TVP38/TMEM64 family)
MRRYVLIFAGLVALFLVLFLAAEALDIRLLTDPQAVLSGRRAGWAAGTGVFLLVVDAVLPVPSSLVMVAHGALFGPVWGALLSLLGRAGFSVSGYLLGRCSAPYALRRIDPAERDRAERLLERWGLLAVVFTRPVPMVAESVSLMAGMSTLRIVPVLAASVLGSLPEAILYALAGSISARFQNTVLIWLFLVGVASGVWLSARPGKRSLTR